MNSKLQWLLSIPPVETMRLVRRRLPVLRNGPSWLPNELLWSSKHGRGIRFAELLLRQEAVVQRHMTWKPLDFEGRRVVEIGCGPLAGFGPLALFCGAELFESAEPEWDAELFFSAEIRDRYLRMFHADLCGLYGPRMDFNTFMGLLDKRIVVHRSSFETAPIAGPVDVVLSQSCLEHVFPADAIVAKLAAIQNGATRFLHLVDFGNHYPTGNPFDGLYEQPPADYIERRGKAINLLRMPDVEQAFTNHGILAAIIPSRVMQETYSGTVHPWWRERYDDKALFTQLALVAGPAL